MKEMVAALEPGAGIREKAQFLARYAACLMGSGVHTSRIMRNAKRIGKAWNLNVSLSCRQKSLLLSAAGRESGESFTTLEEVPSIPVNFELTVQLSHLSWEVLDRRLSCEEADALLQHLTRKGGLPPILTLVLDACGNAAFCALFGGDPVCQGVVFGTTLAGQSLKRLLLARGFNQFIVFVLCAFTASLLASLSAFLPTSTSDIAVATSVLFLIPGVPLINGFMDVLEGNVLTGSSRLISAFLLILYIAAGLALTLMLMGGRLT